MGDPMMQYYYSHPAFDDYPVVGVDWFAAKYFCNWRTKLKTAHNTERELAASPNFRLPSEAEWEYAARGGRDMATFPWGGPYMRNAKGCMLANFKPGRGDYYSDGYSYTAPVGKYMPNEFGLYDMAGNVAEWCEDAYSEAAVPVVWDLNPIYFKDDEPRKVVRGGSWKDISYYLETGTRNFEYQDSARAFIGFRCAMIMLGDNETGKRRR
jgi:gliding motility-associated lipoprotein GldK